MQRFIGAALSLALATGVAACSDVSPSGPVDTIPNAPVGMVVSNALASSAHASALGIRNSIAVSATTVAYVSAAPGTFPEALSVAIRNESTGRTPRLIHVIDGGFDPVGIDAEAGDELSLALTIVGGGSTVVSVKVPPRRPPDIVRTSPSRGRTDVALNVQVEAVFSEPVDASSVTTSSFALRRDGNGVSGKVQVSPDGLSATFSPDVSLDPQTNYSLTIAGDIRDRDGDPLGEVYVVSFTTTAATIGAPTQIAFVRGGAENQEDWANPIGAKSDIYLINSDGTGTIRLTSEPGADVNPAWSPDGRKIAFASERDGNPEIYVMNPDGTDPVRLTNHNRADYAPAYSPDGKRIAFTSDRDGNPEIYVMNADGTNLSRLTNDQPVANWAPAWSPDGSKIAFLSQRIGTTWVVHIYVMNADGSGATPLTTSTNLWPGVPAWSPDGRTIAFGSGNMYLMNADGSDIRRFLSGGTSTSSPDWSPDGSKIAFDDNDCWSDGPCPRAIVIGTIGGQFWTVIDDASEPAWRPR